MKEGLMPSDSQVRKRLTGLRLFWRLISLTIVLVNDGSPLTIRNPYGTGVNDKGVVPDRVIVMLKDRQGNYFEPMMFEVPDYFTK